LPGQVHGDDHFGRSFKPTLIEAGLLADSTNSAAVSAINQQIRTLAPVLNSAPLAEIATVTSTDARVPIDFVVKRHNDATYLFALAMRDGQVDADISVRGAPTRRLRRRPRRGPAHPVGGRPLPRQLRRLRVHLYKITP
jgi:hypothetical protein